MKLLLDENISRRVIPKIEKAFYGSTHVVIEGLQCASDYTIWEYAKAHGYTIVSKDEDFLRMQLLLGYPPKLISLQIGNCTNDQIGRILIKKQDYIKTSLLNEEIGIVAIIGL